MAQTILTGLPYIGYQQTFPDLIYNRNLIIESVVRIHPKLESKTTTAQPGSPTDEQLWYVPASATGTEWASNDGRLALWIEDGLAPSGEWLFFDMIENIYYIADEAGSHANWWKWDGSSWSNAQVTS